MKGFFREGHSWVHPCFPAVYRMFCLSYLGCFRDRRKVTGQLRFHGMRLPGFCSIVPQNILLQYLSSFFSKHFVSVQVVYSWSNIATIASWKKFRFILLNRWDLHMVSIDISQRLHRADMDITFNRWDTATVVCELALHNRSRMSMNFLIFHFSVGILSIPAAFLGFLNFCSYYVEFWSKLSKSDD